MPQVVSTNTELTIIRLKGLGLTDYQIALNEQEQLFNQAVQLKLKRKNSQTSQLPENHLLLCEHHHVYTLGKSGAEENLLLTKDELTSRSIEFFNNNRGGDITYHGPGQMVGYPILDLEQFTPNVHPDIKSYMHSLEEVIIRTIAEYGLKGERLEGAIGIWLDTDQPHLTRKICAFGVKISRWITMHGFALNVNTDLNYFNFIVPCGISDKGVTSMEKELGHKVSQEEIKAKVIRHFGEVFHADIQ